MRVLQFVSTLNKNSGVMSVIMNYYTYIDRSKIQFDFLYFIESDESYMDEIHRLGGKTYRIPKPGFSMNSMKALTLFFKEHGKDYKWLHNHENYLTIVLYPLAKKYGIENIAVHTHLTQYSDKRLSAIRNRILCIPIGYMPIKKAACSKAAAQFLYNTEENVYIMHNMVAADSYLYSASKRDLIRKQYGIKEDIFLIGHIGRFVNQKNHVFLLELFAKFHETNPDSKLMLIGSGGLEQDVKAKAQELQIANEVIFAGQQTDMQGYLSAMDVFVLPSLFEGLPMVALEAQANGLHCILADTITKETAVSSRMQFCGLECMEPWLKAMQKIKKIFGYSRALSVETEQKMNMTELAKKLEQYYSEER